MNFRIATLPLLTALLAAGCQTQATKRGVVVSLSSAMPVSYSGVIRADGQEHAVSGTTPATLTYKAHRVDCRIQQGPEVGMLTIEVKALELPERNEMVTASTGPNTVAKGGASFH